jgi:hypothetical protein
MTRAAHPKEAVRLAHELRALGHGYGRIAREIYSRLGISVGESCIRDWVTYRTRGAML